MKFPIAPKLIRASILMYPNIIRILIKSMVYKRATIYTSFLITTIKGNYSISLEETT